MLRMKGFLNVGLVLIFAVQLNDAYPMYEWVRALYDDVAPGQVANTTTTPISIKEIAAELGISEEFVQQLQANWAKAVLAEKEKVELKLRQGGFGTGGIGDFFGVGGGGGGGVGGGGGGGGAEDEEDGDDDDGVTMAPGPGAAGVLTGLFGIFSGLGSLNPRRVIQSTVNFFPPHQRVAAQMALDMAFGIQNVTTLAPLTNAPVRNGTGRPVGPALVTLNPLATISTTPAAAEKKIETTTRKRFVETTTRKRFQFKETSLLEDFENSAVQLNPVLPKGEEDKPVVSRISFVEKEFAETAEKFKVPSLISESDSGVDASIVNAGNETLVENSTIPADISLSSASSVTSLAEESSTKSA